MQPQAVAWVYRLPVSGGCDGCAVSKMAGSTSSHRLKTLIGEDAATLHSAPVDRRQFASSWPHFNTSPALCICCGDQLLHRLPSPDCNEPHSDEVSDNIRATVLSMQSLLFAFIVGCGRAALGLISRSIGLPSAYIGLAGGLTIVVLLLFWKGRHDSPRPANQQLVALPPNCARSAP